MSEAPPPIPSAGTTESIGEQVDDGRGRMFPCEGCGADFEFNIEVQTLKCPFCGHEKEIALDEEATVDEQDFRATLERLSRERSEKSDEPEFHEVQCASCGSKVQFTGTLTSSDCAYCGSPIQREGVHDAQDRIPVDGMLPFLVQEQKAGDNLKAWVRSRWFLPNDLKKRGISGKFQGVYLPYWTFDSLTVNHYRGERGEYYYVTVGSGDDKRRERRTRWYPAHGSFRRFFDDVMAFASRGLSKDIMLKLEPWPLARVVPFTQELIAGYLSRTYDIPLDKGFVDARGRMDAAIRTDVRRRIGGDTQRIHSIRTHFPAITYKHLLLPVWLLGYKYKGKPYQIAINAATGEVQGQRPWSWVKITLLVLAIVAVVGTGAAVIAMAN